MEAKHTKSGSYARKSILKGREVLKLGVKWRVGDGTSIEIWNDIWLPGKENVKVSNSTDEAHGEETFDLLIDQGSRQWKGNLVDSLFTPLDAAAIKNISCELTMGYTSKTGYHFLREYHEPLTDSPPCPRDKSLWKQVWTLNTPNKIKNLIWRAFRNGIPKKSNLASRTIISDPTYDRCGSAPKDIIHALWACPRGVK
ncbi:hypothetical protein SO802_021840 [Lithocarpus litseifolius]|uniref:Reverse transcriptase zinc-binding domain-containing protein n=1 Tax=Lithocarpus litseifolius TaxID=425828 RepID=A0AAW2CIY5_9ROSI